MVIPLAAAPPPPPPPWALGLSDLPSRAPPTHHSGDSQPPISATWGIVGVTIENEAASMQVRLANFPHYGQEHVIIVMFPQISCTTDRVGHATTPPPQRGVSEIHGNKGNESGSRQLRDFWIFYFSIPTLHYVPTAEFQWLGHFKESWIRSAENRSQRGLHLMEPSATIRGEPGLAIKASQFNFHQHLIWFTWNSARLSICVFFC